MADPVQTTPEGQPAPPPVAPVGPGNAPATPTPSPSAASTAPLFGGLRGGRTRKDGLKPGSPEAIAADREKDRLRKENQRKRQQPPEPDPLPGMAGAAQAAPGAQPNDGGTEDAPFVPWEAKMLEPLLKQLTPAIEELRSRRIMEKAALARIPADISKEIEADAKFPEAAKRAVELSGAQVGAKWLNKLGVSAENQPEIALGTALTFLLTSHVLLMRRLAKLIEVSNAPSKQPGQSQLPAGAAPAKP